MTRAREMRVDTRCLPEANGRNNGETSLMIIWNLTEQNFLKAEHEKCADDEADSGWIAKEGDHVTAQFSPHDNLDVSMACDQ